MVLTSLEKTYFRGAPGYEAARRATVWNGLLPERFPDVIMQAHDTADVVTALRYARENGHKVGVRSGGHSWAANHLRDGGLLLDVSRLDHCRVDAGRMTAEVGPGKSASGFATELDAQGLFFPSGHCEGIGLGGFLLQGGYGWNSPAIGMACESVLGLDVVTADGEQIYCDPEHHPDLYWAARGAGTGFFGVVTSFKLRIHQRPAVVGTCLYMYPIELADEVYTWGRDISAEVDPRVELQILATLANRSRGQSADHHHRLAGVRPIGRGGGQSPCASRHLPGSGQGDGQSALHAHHFGELVHRRHDQLPRGAPLHRRQHVHVGSGR